ncbi:hypothetical protein IHE44_0005984 [Lamprotornis superbus]|uniref:SAM domain-containing protein n=1 Tax=Lamprotornis superbus TaxID=245042 RepID=A0A835NFM2_9PASS|nr:hypothetical protein IHE44_0005984 [Lamprotornis superbus]
MKPSNLLLDQSNIDISAFRTTGDWLNGFRTGQCKDIFTGVEYSSCDTIAKISTDWHIASVSLYCLSHFPPNQVLNHLCAAQGTMRLEILDKPEQYPCTWRLLQCSSVRWASSLLFAEISAGKLSVLTHTPSLFSSDMKKVGVTVVGPQKKIVSSIKALETHTKNSPVPV